MRRISDILETAHNRIFTPGSWTQGALARDSHGVEVGPRDLLAVQWDPTGALIASIDGYSVGDHDDVWELEICESYLVEALGLGYRPHDGQIDDWNDDIDRTHAQVLELFSRAILSAKEDE